MIPSAILGRYARSLAEVVFEENCESKVSEDIAMYNEIFLAVPGILEAFDSPAIPRESKERLLTELMAHYPVSPITANFLRILLRHNRIRYFEQIRNGYLKGVNDAKGIVSAHVTTASPISSQDSKKLTARLAEITGKRVNLELKTDPDLLGGIVVRMGSTIFDGSIRTQLGEMKRQLAEM